MKQFYIFLSFVALGTFANAQTEVLNETFSFTGSLNTGNNGWFQHSGTIDQLTADGSVANLVAGNSEDSNKAISSAYDMSTSSTIYKAEYSVDVTALNSTGLTTTGDYFLSLTGTVTTSDVTTGISSLIARLYVKAGTSGFLLGVVNNSGTGIAPNYITTETPYGTFVNAKVTYEVTKDGTGAVILQQATLTVGSETITNTTGTGTPPAQLAGIAIREAGNATSGTGNLSLDNIIVKTYTPTTLAVRDYNQIEGFSMYPNPAKNQLTIRTADNLTKNVQIFNVLGKQVLAKTMTGNTLDINLPTGIYVVKVEEAGKIATQKLMVQ